MKRAWPGKTLAFLLLFIAARAAAGQAPENLAGFLPASGEVAGLTQSDTPQGYHGDDLYQMIDGGADIYHEYGFRQVLSAEYVDGRGKIIKLEMYEMESPAAAYGIYSFKVGEGGKAIAIGQEGLIEGYYLNFWKGNLQITLIGQDSEEETVQGVVTLAGAVAARIAQTGERPELADLLLREPLPFSHPKYLRGTLGLMNNYLFDRENIFRVRRFCCSFRAAAFFSTFSIRSAVSAGSPRIFFAPYRWRRYCLSPGLPQLAAVYTATRSARWERCLDFLPKSHGCALALTRIGAKAVNYARMCVRRAASIPGGKRWTAVAA